MATSREEKRVQNEILLKLGSHPDFRCWRHTVGVGVGLYIVRQAIKLLLVGRAKQALSILRAAQPIKFGMAGQSDISAIHKCGRSVWIEVKAPGKLGEESPEQKNWGAMIQKFGGFYACVDSVNMLWVHLLAEGLIEADL